VHVVCRAPYHPTLAIHSVFVSHSPLYTSSAWSQDHKPLFSVRSTSPVGQTTCFSSRSLSVCQSGNKSGFWLWSGSSHVSWRLALSSQNSSFLKFFSCIAFSLSRGLISRNINLSVFGSLRRWSRGSRPTGECGILSQPSLLVPGTQENSYTSVLTY